MARALAGVLGLLVLGACAEPAVLRDPPAAAEMAPPPPDGIAPLPALARPTGAGVIALPPPEDGAPR